MCKQRRRETAQRQTPFEGETIRLNGRAAVLEQTEQTERRCQPGWTMHRHMLWWMIWPLISLIKWLAPLVLGAVASISQMMVSVPLLVSMVLIVAGLLLWRRR